MVMHKKLLIVFQCLFSLILTIVLIQGCSPKHYVRGKTDIKGIKKIAVLPFENFTADEAAGEKIRRIVIADLLSKGVETVEPGEVTRVLRDFKIKSLNVLKLSEIKDMGKTLGTDAVMSGAVEYYGMSKGVSVNYPEVTVNLRLIETASGAVLWSVRNTSGGPDFWTRHFGSEGNTLSETAGDVVREAIRTLF
jgi:TolB-like protein